MIPGIPVMDWRHAAITFGEQLAPTAPMDYYTFSPEQWLVWAQQHLKHTSTADALLAAEGRREEQENDHGAALLPADPSASVQTEALPDRCDGRYPSPMKRDEPFDVTYRCALPLGHPGPCGAEISPAISAIGRNLSHALRPTGSDLSDWKQAALILGEHLATCGPDGYYRFTPDQWLAWARTQIGSGNQVTPEHSDPTRRSAAQEQTSSIKDSSHE